MGGSSVTQVEPRARGSLTEPLLAAGLAATSVAVVGLVYPRYPELFPACPSRTLFGVWCPLCGGTRSAHALATGDLGAAVGFNAFVPVLVVLTAWSWTAWISRLRSTRGPTRRAAVAVVDGRGDVARLRGAPEPPDRAVRRLGALIRTPRRSGP
jgi:hypothetical protein